MRLISVLSCLLACLAALAETLPPAGVLEFLDGGLLHGRLRSMSPERGVSWEYPEAVRVIEFKPSNIASILFEDTKPVANAAKPTCYFRCHNGDEFYGTLSTIDAEHVGLTTWFGDNVKVPRAAVRRIAFFWKGFAMLYDGPNGLEGWQGSQGAKGWQYQDGGLRTTGAGTIGRKFNLPDASSVEFDLAWSGPFALAVTLYADVFERFDYSVSSYTFHVSTGLISFQRIQSGVGIASLGRAEIPQMAGKKKMRLEFRVDKPTATFAVLADGQPIARWKDNGAFVGKGGGVVFSSQIEGPVVRLSNIRVSEWDGPLEDDRSTNAPPAGDLAVLVNRDKVAGELQAVRDGKMTFAAPQARLEIPLPRVREILLGRTNAADHASHPWDVRAQVAGGGTVAFRLEQWQSDRVTGTSATLGPLVLNPQSIRELQFNRGRAKSSSDSTSPDDAFEGFHE